MANKTAISWTDATWNPIIGCYAFALHNKRYRANVKAALIYVGFIDQGERHIRHSESWPQYAARVGPPLEGWPARARSLGVTMPYPRQYDLPFAKVQLHPERLDAPLRWHKPRRVFVNSMSDLFHEEVPDTFIDELFAIMALAVDHTFQVLTKRPERMSAYLGTAGVAGRIARALTAKDLFNRRSRHLSALADRVLSDVDESGRSIPASLTPWPLPNVWLGVSVEDQATADERIPLLLATPAAVRFVSCEPLLAPIDLTRIAMPTHGFLHPFVPEVDALDRTHFDGLGFKRTIKPGLDWVIVGGESGPRARPMDHAWARSLREQCRATGVAYWGKQDSGRRQGVPLPGDLGDQEWPEP